MKVIIIGGDAAGMSAAMQLIRSEQDVSITVLEKGEIYSYAQCGLPYYVGDVVESRKHLIARTREKFQEDGIDARIFHEVTRVDENEKRVYGTVHEADGSKTDFEEAYDKLLVASGGSPVMPDWKGNDLEGIHVLKTIPDADELKEALDGVLTVTIIGGGYIGLEVAENLVELGKNVRIINRAERLGVGFDKKISDKLIEEAERQNIHLSLGEEVSYFSGETRVNTVTTNKGTYETDLVIVAVGIEPNTRFLNDTSIHLHANGAVVVNPYMESNVADIYAAGDCATQYHRIKRLNDYIPLGTTANKQGRIAGLRMAGSSRTFNGIVGTAIMKFFDVDAGRTGLSTAEAESLGIPYDVNVFEHSPHAGYYPGGEKLWLQLVRHKVSHQLLGVQAVGTQGIAKRIDVAAVALFNEMTTEELQDLDLSYAPPFNTTWDPIQKSARRFK
ncbi:CoA-disulfide reductase [Paenalkalicoccus suaedae]|uniref:CoA-disulfide reductase n=1 Tax=Paenalkalicoccus suaedae TaxID=2592382 RepID=A0A859FI42_9BACI|nr:CoA-disulfide reductase [Paenalkalicoccus suaedae]QKS72771.1 CoA-disulfide reductase [Paenalkalicoccus suaedae]